MSFDEPMPKLPPRHSYVPIWITWALATAVAFSVDLPLRTLWGATAWVPWAGYLAFFAIRSNREHRAFMSAQDVWSERMHAHYDRLMMEEGG